MFALRIQRMKSSKRVDTKVKSDVGGPRGDGQILAPPKTKTHLLDPPKHHER